MNPKASRRGRNSGRAGLTLTSTIALALGGAAVVAPTPHAGAQEATGENLAYTGDIVARGDQHKREALGADSCAMELYNTDEGKNHAGLKFDYTNPDGDSPSKTKFGLQMHFDISKQRTFTGVNFADSGLVPVNTGDLGVVPEGEKLTPDNPFTVNDTAAPAEITAGGRQRNLNGDFTFSEQFQQKATGGEGLTLAWRDNYTTDNPKVKFFSDNFLMNANVNPWPSETDKCQPLKLDWKNVTEAVVKPGKTVKIASAPADVAESDLDRLRIKVADGNGKTLNNVTITREGSDFYLTWPKFVDDASLDSQQNLTFTAVAMPRTVEQLNTLAENAHDSQEFPIVGEATDSSIALPRYNTANEISSHSISVDDTRLHNPQYTKNQVAITSGVANNTPTDQPQEIIFEEVADENGDTLADLKTKYDAKITLDDRLIYEGWDAKFADPDNGDYRVIVTAPAGFEKPVPGTFAQPVVNVRYTNGSKDVIPLLVVVNPNHTQQTQLDYPAEPKQKPQGVEMKHTPTLTRVLGKGDVIKPVKYEIVEGSYDKDNWDVKIDPDTGEITATAKENVPNFTVIKPKVKATYPDGTTDEAPAPFQVVSNVKVPEYGATSGKAEDKVTLQPTLPQIGLGGKEDDEQPNRYTFPDGTLEYKVGDWTITVDEKTGELTSTIPKNALPGAYITVPVKTHYASGSVPQEVTGTINVIGDGSGSDIANYPPQVTKAGVPISSNINTQLSDPKLAKYELPKRLPKGWTFDVAEDGTVTATPPKDAKPGDEETIDIHVNYPDGSEADVPVTVTVVGADNEMNNPKYPTKTGKPGHEVTSPVDKKDIHRESEPKFSLITDPDDPNYIKPPRNLTWDQVKIDPKTGTITTPISKDAVPGTSADIPVRVTYKDGTTDSTIATVVVVGDQANVHEPRYEQQETKPGVAKTSDITKDTKVPDKDLNAKTPYSVPKTVDGWTVSVDDKGVVTATPPKTAKPGDHIDVPVTVKYQDGSEEVVNAPFVVRQKDKDIYEPGYSVESTGPNKSVKRQITPKDLPKNTKYELEALKQGDWKYEINPDTGEVTVTPPADAKPGDKQTKNVTVTYPDGSTEDVPVTTIVNLTNNYEAEPAYPPETTYPGEQAVSPLSIEKPEGLEVAKENPYLIQPEQDKITPTGKNNEFGNPIYKVLSEKGKLWDASLDKDGNILATPPADAEPGDLIHVPVLVTYADGSVDTTSAPITVVGRPTTENTDVSTAKVEVPFETRIVFDPELEVGEQKVDPEHPGVPGKDEVTTTRTIENSQITDTRTEKTRVTDPQDRIIRVGTKEKPGITPEIHWTEETPFKVIVKEDPTLDAGTHKIAQPGKVGKISYKVIDGVPQKPEVQEPVDQIILVGTKKQTKQTELRETIHTPVPFETEIRKVDTLPAGAVRTKQEGTYGEKVTEKVWKLVDGTVQGDPVENTTDIKQPTKRIIEVGVGKVVPTYGKIVQDPGATNEVPLQEGSKVPANAKVEIDPDWKPEIEGWKATIDEHGNVLSTPPADAKPGDSVLIPVKVTYEDGSSVIVPAFASVKDKSDTPQVNYGALKTLPGETHTQQPENATEGDKFSVPGDVDGWEVSIDEHGVVSATTPKDAKPGDWIRVPVTVTPKNGETYTAYAVFTVGNQPIKPSEPLKPGEPGQPDEPGQPGSPEVPGLYYPPAITTPGAEAQIKIGKHTDGNTYALGALPKGWKATVSKEGDLLVTPPADATPGEKVDIPVTVTTASGKKYEVKTVVGVIAKDNVKPGEPGSPADGSSADGFKRCMANMFALNSPILWLLPIGLAAAVGAPIAEALQPQLNGLTAQFNEAVRRNTPDWGHGGHGWERPDWVREIDAQVAAINKQFAPVGEQLRPMGIALGAIAAGALAISLIKQACEPEGFDYGMTIFGSSKEGEPSAASSKKGAIHDAIMGGSSKENKEK